MISVARLFGMLPGTWLSLAASAPRFPCLALTRNHETCAFGNKSCKLTKTFPRSRKTERRCGKHDGLEFSVFPTSQTHTVSKSLLGTNSHFFVATAGMAA